MTDPVEEFWLDYDPDQKCVEVLAVEFLEAEVERLNKSYNDLADVAEPIAKRCAKAEAEVERLRTWLGERHAYYRKEYAYTFSDFDLGCAEAYDDVLIEMEERE